MNQHSDTSAADLIMSIRPGEPTIQTPGLGNVTVPTEWVYRNPDPTPEGRGVLDYAERNRRREQWQTRRARIRRWVRLLLGRTDA